MVMDSRLRGNYRTGATALDPGRVTPAKAGLQGGARGLENHLRGSGTAQLPVLTATPEGAEG